MIDLFEHAALEAGRTILDLYRNGCDIREKTDGSPVTAADIRAENIIRDELSAAFPSVPIVAEESAASGLIPKIHGKRFFLVDALDGTREFIGRTAEFTVNIALIDNGTPVVGIVYAPALQLGYTADYGVAKSLKVNDNQRVVDRVPIKVRTRSAPPVAVASRSHTSSNTKLFLDTHGIEECRSLASSLKFCLVAAGEVDLYPRLGRTMEWDTAAGDAVLRAAGGTTVLLDGKLLRYGKCNQERDVDFANPPFVAWGQI